MAPHNAVTIYKEWVNSILCEAGIQIHSLRQLNSGKLLWRLYTQLVSVYQDNFSVNDRLLHEHIESLSNSEALTRLLGELQAAGIRITQTAQDIAKGDSLVLLDLLWPLILHYTIHNPVEVKTSQRNLGIGTKLLLQWCSQILDGACFDYRLSFSDNMEKDILHNIINRVSGLVSLPHEPEPCDYHEAIAEAENRLGVSSNILRACDSQTEDIAVTVYVSLLRRKKELILKGRAPNQPSILLGDPEPVHNLTLPFGDAEALNGMTQKIERQSSFCRSSCDEVTDNLSDILMDAVSKSNSNLSKVPTSSSGTINSDLQIDLTQLPLKSNYSDSSSPREAIAKEESSEFIELLRQLKDRQRDSSSTPVHFVNGGGEKYTHTDSHHGYLDTDRVSVKSHPTDEGFGTYTKTTPRTGKTDDDSDTIDENDETLEEDLREHAEESITEWWDKIEVSDTVQTLEKIWTKATEPDVNQLTLQDSNGAYELSDDELMHMLNNIGMNGIKASTSLQAAQDVEMRLLQILKERDDLVLSYHNSLKELSKLTARINDENHLLRQQLNVTDMSNGDIFLALEDEVASGRQIALRLQNELSDQHENVVSRLRDEKRILQERLTAVQREYSAEIQKWHAEREANHKAMEDVSNNFEAQDSELKRENRMLQMQLDELRNMFDLTLNRTQAECSQYLETIDRLQTQSPVSPISQQQLTSLQNRQSDMERLYEAMISSLEADNTKLNGELAALQETILQLEKISKVDSATQSDINYPSPEEIQEWTTRVTALQEEIERLTDTIANYQSERARTEKETMQRVGENNKLQAQLANMTEQLGIAQRKYSTLESLHQLAIKWNEELKSQIKEKNEEMDASRTAAESLRGQLMRDIDAARAASAADKAELTMVKEQLVILRMDNSKYKKIEVNLNAELNSLTLERGKLQSTINDLKAQLFSARNESMMESTRCQQLEKTIHDLEGQTDAFKRETLDLFQQLEKVQQEKDDLDQRLGSLQNEIGSSMASWKDRLEQEKITNTEKLDSLRSEIDEYKFTTGVYKTDNEKLRIEMAELQTRAHDTTEKYEKIQKKLSEILEAARVKSDDPANELRRKIESFEKQLAEYKFTTTHFRDENSQLQLRVNQLEDRNKLTEERNSILQKELNSVQSSLDDSLSSHNESRINILDLSMTDLMATHDLSELRQMILSARKEVEKIQKKRKSNNIEYSKKIMQMEAMLKDKEPNSTPSTDSSQRDLSTRANSQVDSSLADPYDKPFLSSSAQTKDILSTASADARRHKKGPHIGDVLDEEKPTLISGAITRLRGMVEASTTASQPSNEPLNLSKSAGNLRESRNLVTPLQTTICRVPDEDLSMPDNLHLRVEHLMSAKNEADFSLPSYARQSSHNPYLDSANPYVSRQRATGQVASSTLLSGRKSASFANYAISLSGKPEAKSTGYVSGIEQENATLKAELEMISNERSSLRQQQLIYQSEQQDVLNETLEELEKSLDEVGQTNKILRTTLENSVEFLQNNITPQNLGPCQRQANPPYTACAASRKHTPVRARPESARLSSSTPLPGPECRSWTPAPASTYRVNGSPEAVNSGSPDMWETESSTSWSANADPKLVSSCSFNKLQQTNVNNYDHLLYSDSNTKRGSAAGRRSSDLNTMIQHSLLQLHKAATPPSHSSDDKRSTPATPQRVSYTPGSHTPVQERVVTASPDDYLSPSRGKWSGITRSPSRPHNSGRHFHWDVYNDGGPDRYEPKEVLPEPNRSIQKAIYHWTDTDSS